MTPVSYTHLGALRLLKEIAELTLQDPIGILGHLLLAELKCILALLATTIIAVLTWGIVFLTQDFVCTEDGFTKLACNLGPVSYTHLDVYKRQGHTSVGAPSLAPAVESTDRSFLPEAAHSHRCV